MKNYLYTFNESNNNRYNDPLDDKLYEIYKNYIIENMPYQIDCGPGFEKLDNGTSRHDKKIWLDNLETEWGSICFKDEKGEYSKYCICFKDKTDAIKFKLCCL